MFNEFNGGVPIVFYFIRATNLIYFPAPKAWLSAFKGKAVILGVSVVPVVADIAQGIQQNQYQ